MKGRGISSVISTSKIRKITAIRKNRMEKDRRLEVLLSNPHSNGEGFSRSVVIFFARKELRKIKITESLRARANIKDIIIIKLIDL